MSKKTSRDEIVKNEQAKEEERKSHQELQVFFSQTIDGCFFMMLDEPVWWNDTAVKEPILDYVFAHQHLTQVNDALLAQYGATREQMLSLTPNDLFAHNRVYGRKLWRKLFDVGKIQLESDERKLDGTPMWIAGEYIALSDSEERITGYFGIQRDVTERKQAEMEIARVNRALRMLSDVNRTVIYAADETALLYDVCRIAVEGGGYLMAWVGFAEQDKAKTVRPVTHAGFEEGYLESLNLTWAENGRGDDPVGTAIRTGQLSVVRNLSDQQGDDDWPKTAVQRGYKSMIALPLNSEGRVLGTFNIYAGEADAFDDREVEILEELAADLAFGITALHNQAKRDQAEEALRESEERYRLIAENTADTIAIFDLDLKPTYISPSVLKLRGYTVQEALAQSLDQIVTSESFQKAQDALVEQMLLEAAGTADPSRTVLLELEEYCKDGSTIWIEISASFLRDTNLAPTGILTVTRDITERKRAEDALRQRELHAQSLVRLSRRLEQAQTYAEVLDAGATEVRNTIGYQNLWIYLLSEDKTTYRALMAGGPMMEVILSDEGAATLTITGDPMLEAIAEAREIVLVEDARTDKRTNKEIVAQLGNRTIINIPILLFDRHLGTVGTGTFGDEGIRIPTQPEQEYLIAVASHFAVSLDRIHSLTERERANSALRKSEERYRIVADNTYDWEFWINPSGQFLYNSPSCQRITGYTVDQFMREPDLLHRIVHPEDYEQFLRHEQRVAETKLPDEIEFRILHADGSVRYIGHACQQIYDERGQYLGVRGSNRDITERKQAEEALRVSEERFSKAFHLSPMGIAIFRAADGQFVDVNDVFLQVSGYGREEVIGHTAVELQLYANPEERDFILQTLQEKGTLETFEFQTRSKSGEIGVGLSATTEITLGGGKHYLSLILDITERKQAEGDLRKLSHAIEQSPVAIIITDTDGAIEYVNPNFTQLSGYARDETIGKNPRLLKSGETTLDEYQRLWDTITQGGSWQGEFHNKKKTGELYWVSASISPVLDAQGNIKNFVGVQEDITARKQRERALEALVTVALALRVASSRDEVVHVVVNQVYELLRSGNVALLLHYLQDDELDVTAVRGPWEQWPSLRFPLGEEISNRVIATGQPYINDDVRTDALLYRPDLIGNLVAVACVPLIAENEVIGVLWVGQQSPIGSHDLQLLNTIADMAATAIRRAVLHEQTQRYAAQLEARVAERTHELAKANEQLLELDQLKTKFVSNVSHELRTPITSLQLYLELIKQGKPEKREQYIDILRQQSNRLARLVEDILDLSRLELGANRTSFAPVNLNQLVAQIITIYQAIAENANLRLAFEPGPDLPPVIGEANQLAQVVTNLVANALNYTMRGSIQVWTHLEDDSVCLDVTDTGLGINPEDVPHLFERFYRGKYVSQGDIPGTGLGLAIVKEIVDVHGGSIAVDSQLGKGTTFSVRLPFAAFQDE